jgi:hypothetical protein
LKKTARRKKLGGKTTNTIDVIAYSSPLNKRLPKGDKSRRINTMITHNRTVKYETMADWARGVMDSVDEAIALAVDSARGEPLAPPIYRRVINITDAQDKGPNKNKETAAADKPVPKETTAADKPSK